MALTNRPYAWTLLFLLPLAGALVNIDLFGDQTLAAYFFYCIPATGVAMIFTLRLLFAPPLYRSAILVLPAPQLLFIVLALFVFAHGLITHTLGLTHYYWLAAAAWFWAAGRLVLLADTGTITNIYNGVACLALLESLIVFLQALHILPSENPFYTCTGSWENPNVTAMFLSLAVFAALKGILAARRRSLGWFLSLAWFLISLILVAILLLQCRTAILVAALFLTGHFWAPLTSFFNNRSRLFKIRVVAGALVFCAAAILLLSFGVKKASSRGRIRVWANSIRLIESRPLTGLGFGRFEKGYNFFMAKEARPDNDHVNMPYNDFFELGVEGGLGAVALWTAWLIVLWRYHRRQGNSVLPVIAFLVIQLTNFGFQALPAFALFLLYAAMPPTPSSAIPPKPSSAIPPTPPSAPPIPAGDFKKIRLPASFFRASLVCILGLTGWLFIHQVNLADKFYARNIITREDTGNDAIEAYTDLAPSLDKFVSFHIYFGDAWLKMHQYRPALTQYLQGLETSSRPDLLLKCGYCYQQLRLYDSSRYYYTLVGNMMPYKFSPRMALLKLYQQQGDSLMTRQAASAILAMPVKVESSEAESIKKYAREVLNKGK